MNIDDIKSQGWILALFIRDDGERFLLGDGYYEFAQSLQHFKPNSLANDVVELQGADGQLLAGQVIRSADQNFKGYIGDASTSQAMIEQKRQEFFRFFRVRRFYTVVYILPSGLAVQRKRGYLTEMPNAPELWQKFPEYSLSMNFEDTTYYEYNEDEGGDETYANTVQIGLSGATGGGLIWDNVGVVWDSIGAEWEAGGTGGPTTVTVVGIDYAEPVWKVVGPATNPTLTNTTTGQSLKWTGTVPGGQTLVIDMAEQTATLEGANVFEFVSGSWVQLRPGNNRVSYTATGGATDPSTLSWNGVVG